MKKHKKIKKIIFIKRIACLEGKKTSSKFTTYTLQCNPLHSCHIPRVLRKLFTRRVVNYLQ